MTTRQDPVTGNFLSNGPALNLLTRAQYDLAAISDSIAEDIMREWDKGYFTAFSLKQMAPALAPLLTHGILTIHKSQKHDGNYYKPTYITRAWCLTSLALAQERKRLFKERTENSQRG